jgi:hypothetical protein
MATAEQPPATGEAGSSTVNRVLLYLLLVGVGVIAGVGGFYALWQTSCTELLHVASARQNASLESLQEQYSKAASAHKRCLEDDNSKKKFHELQDRLEAQTKLAGKHQDLLVKHEATLEKLNEVQKAHDSSRQTVSSLNEQIKRLQRELGQSTVQVHLSKQKSDQQVEALKDQLDLSRTMLREKMVELERAQSETGSSRGSDTSWYKTELNAVTTAIRRRSLAQLVMKYGEGPYTIQFTLDLPSPPESSEQQSFSIVEVEFRLIPEMAYTLWTILNLVDLELYTGTTIGTVDDLSAFGGRPQDAALRKDEARLARRYAETGYGAEPLLFEEISPRAPCVEYSFGIVGKGPGFFFPLVAQHQDGSVSCPGLVVKGKHTLSRLENLPKQDRVTIINASVIIHTAWFSGPEGEL